MVFDKPAVLPRLAQGVQTFIPVVSTREVERELGSLSRTMHCIIVCPRNASNADPNIVLEPVPYETFRKALEEMKKDRDDVPRLANASGRSLTVLRRRLSNVPAVQTPKWAEDHKIAESLVPFLFVGAWNSNNETDKEAMSLIADRPYPALEKECQHLTQLNDAPLWSIGSFRGVISKLDLLFAISGSITKDDLKRYLSLARMVLGEDDPTLDLTEEERWAASIHGKVREFSTAFRKGVSETLVLLAVYGNPLFKTRLGIDTEIEATKVVRDLLPAPLTTRSLAINDHDLPTYAEAVPDTFLSIIEEDLKTNEPAVLGLLRPADTGVFGRSPSRTRLLWALEGLAWNPETLSRVALILARLAQVEIKDNWVNKPMHSLESIFRSWMPQTAASHEKRVDVMKKITERFPKIAWKICVSQFGAHSAVGDYSHKPQWRPDGYGFGEPFPTLEPVWKFQREMVEMAINWKGHTLNMICDLVSHLDALDEAYQARVWDLVKAWTANSASDDDKVALREKLRVTTLSYRAARRAKKSGQTAALSQAAKDAYAALEPADLLNKHAWLFRENWVEESYEEIHDDEEIDFRKREERINALRTDALREILEKHGHDGIFSIAERGKAAWQIGCLLANNQLSEEHLVKLLRNALAPILVEKSDVLSRKSLIAGALRFISSEARETILIQVADDLTENDKVRLLLLAPFCRSTWKFIDKLGQDAQNKYWTDVAPDWIVDSDDENNEAVDRLLKAERPRAAFACVRYRPEKMGAHVLSRLLSDIAKGGKEHPGHYQLEQHSIEQAFKHINASHELTLEENAGLEFAYIDVLARPWSSGETHGIPNLERYVEMHPEFFVQAVAWTYKRGDDGIDPPELRTEADNIQHRAERGYKLLEGLERIPGHNDLGELEGTRLAKWVNTVRESCANLGRGDIGDVCIGKLLSSAPAGTDGVWPCEAVRDVMEEICSKKMVNGAHTGLYNARGVHWRGEGGDQERELANKYRRWAKALQFTHPYVSSELLMGMVKTYEHEASQEDTQAGIRRRLR